MEKLPQQIKYLWLYITRITVTGLLKWTWQHDLQVGVICHYKMGGSMGSLLHVYLGFMAAEGNDASDSVYLGMVRVASK